MIQLKGQEAVNQAYYVVKNKEFLMDFCYFHFIKNGRRELTSPDHALERLKNREARVEELFCEMLSVWDVLLMAEREGSIIIHPSVNVVLIVTMDSERPDAKGMNIFAIQYSVFEVAVQCAMNSPIIDKNFDFDNFIRRLSPRMHIQTGCWRQDPEILRYSTEIANELMAAFDIDPHPFWERLHYGHRTLLCGEGPLPLVHGGLLLDDVLDKISHFVSGSPAPVFSEESSVSSIRQKNTLRGLPSY